MSTDRCWCSLPTGDRCPEPAVPSTHFCAHHSRNGPPNPMAVFRAPEAEMPPDLVQAMRRYAPEITFPQPEPPAAALPAGEAPAHPLPRRHSEPVPSSPTEAPKLSDALNLSDASAPSNPSENPAALTPSNEDPASPSPADFSASPCLRVDTQNAELDWLLAALRRSTGEVLDCEAPPVQKANAVVRLGALYLKASGAAELKRAVKELERRADDLEEANAELRRQVAELQERAAFGTERDAELNVAVAPSGPGGEAQTLRDAAGTSLPPSEPAALVCSRPSSPCENGELLPGALAASRTVAAAASTPRRGPPRSPLGRRGV